MKNSVVLNISKAKSFLNIFHKGELIGRIEVADKNPSNRVSLKLRADADLTRYILSKDDDETKFNREEYNR